MMSTELVPITNDIDRAQESQFLERIVEATAALQNASTLLEIKEIRDIAEAAQAYAKARNSKTAHQAASELRLRAEREAGRARGQLPRGTPDSSGLDYAEARKLRESGLSYSQVGRKLGVHRKTIAAAERRNWQNRPGTVKGGSPVGDLDRQFGVSAPTAVRWERLSEMPEEIFEQAIRDAHTNDLSLTAGSVLKRVERAGQTRLERGIFQTPSGRLIIQASYQGRTTSRVMHSKDIGEARERLALLEERISKTPKPRGRRTPAICYSLIRRALQIADYLDTENQNPRFRQAIKEAISHLHRAEDAVIEATNWAQSE